MKSDLHVISSDKWEFPIIEILNFIWTCLSVAINRADLLSLKICPGNGPSCSIASSSQFNVQYWPESDE